MADIEVADETEQQDGWSYRVAVTADGRRHDFRVTLAQTDYEQWSQGRVPSAQVVRAAFEFLLDNEPPSAIMGSFDCSVIRRFFPQVDEELPRRLG